MIKKVFIISSILFFALAGNVFAQDIVYRSDTIIDYLGQFCTPGNPTYNNMVFFNDTELPVGYYNINSCDTSGDILKTWGEIWGEEWNNHTIYLLSVFSHYVSQCLPDYDYCISGGFAHAYPRPQITLKVKIGSVLTMPETASSDLLANVGGLFTDFWPIIAMMFGIPLAFYIIPRVIELVVVRDKS